tara:strand:- start:33586 stop:34734 length:1149 start_codon:yes stop_codon:yes gene_type:complete
MKLSIGIKALGSISALGKNSEEILNAYNNNSSYIQKRNNDWQVPLGEFSYPIFEEIRDWDRAFSHADKSLLMALQVSKVCLETTDWKDYEDSAVFFGSSRGAAEQLENNHELHLKGQAIHPFTSPLTSMGNISALVARQFGIGGFNDTLSMTCSSSFHALIQGIVWLQSGMKEKVLVGGTEAPLTPFFIQQLKSLGLYSKLNGEYPNRSLDLNKDTNTMVLGEGAACVSIESAKRDTAYLARITGMGYGMEKAPNITGLSSEAFNIQKAMTAALEAHEKDTIDLIICHAPGTKKGDAAELKAIEKVFGDNFPEVTSNKWKLGHTLGASGLLSLEMAILMLHSGKIFFPPYLKKNSEGKARKIMINSLGFGGNAISIIVESNS